MKKKDTESIIIYRTFGTLPIIVSDFLDFKKKRRIIRVFFRNITANF